MSLTIVPTSPAEPIELVKIWSMRDVEVPCILVALVINWRNQLLITVSMRERDWDILSKLAPERKRLENSIQPITRKKGTGPF